MDMQFSAGDERFRRQVQQFLQQHLSAELKEASAKQTSVFAFFDASLQWQRILYQQGWVAPNWPEQFGGTGWGVVQRYIFNQELVRAGAPSLLPMGLGMVAHVIMKFGTRAQQQFYLPRILSTEDFWCQGYSEPGSGSDLASLKTKAISDGDDYIVSGSKIWTTYAHHASHIFCLVRSAEDVKPQQGISFLLIDMQQPGITVQPIITLAGDHEVNQVFFDDVRVPKTNLIGEENQGWTVAKYLLEFERGDAHSAGLFVKYQHLKQLAARESCGSGSLLSQVPEFAQKMAQLEINLQALEVIELRSMSALSRGGSPGAESSMLKNLTALNTQAIDELAMQTIAYLSAPDDFEARQLGSNAPPIGRADTITVSASYLNNRASSIYGGSYEVQSNIMAKLVLGL